MQQTTWNFDNSYTKLPSDFFEFQRPTPVQQPKILLLNKSLIHDLGIDYLLEDNETTALHLSGNIIPSNAEPIAQAYAGHQFGYFNMLGDGRAILLGEHVTAKNKRFDIQLKGSGQTPFSRRGDGRATLRSMLREYLISEAMFYLRIPTSRSLAVIGTDDVVYREQLHKGAILTRVMSSHIRVGTFEFAKQFCSVEDCRIFTNYVINRHYPELANAENPVLEFLKTVVKKQTDLVLNWMRVGFIHGVMNTDNTSIAAETFDYGPCAFMNVFNPKTVFSSIDIHGRYAFQNQPAIIKWNMHILADTLMPLIHDSTTEATELVQQVMNDFDVYYVDQWYKMMFAKIGLEDGDENDKPLVNELLHWMYTNKADYTNTFFSLRNEALEADSNWQPDGLTDWLTKWKNRITEKDITAAKQLMQQNNPCYIARNHLVEEALDNAVNGNFSEFNQLLQILQQPYQLQQVDERFQYYSPTFDNTYKTFCGT